MADKVGIMIDPDGPCRWPESNSSTYDSPVCMNCGWLLEEHDTSSSDHELNENDWWEWEIENG